MQGQAVEPAVFIRAGDKAVNAYFQGAARYWEEVYRGHDLQSLIYQQRRLVALAWVDKLLLPPGTAILEVGCGAGLVAVALAQRGFTVEAIDTSTAMLEQTRRLAAETGVSQLVSAHACDVHQLAYHDEQFRLVLAIGVIPWLHSEREPIREMARVLRPGGYLVLSADHRWRLNRVLDPAICVRQSVGGVLRRLGLRPRVAGRRLHSIWEVDAALASAGLQKLEGRTLGFGPFSFLSIELVPATVGIKLHQKLQALADRGVPLLRSIGSQYLVLAQKIGVGPF